MDSVSYLLDVNTLLALADKDHLDNPKAEKFFETLDLVFGVCAFTEAGFIRLAMNPAVIDPAWTVYEAIQFLEKIGERPGYRYWAIEKDWRLLLVPFLSNIQGHNQVPDAYLLGLAASQGGVLVTTDKKLRSISGPRHLRHLLILE